MQEIQFLNCTTKKDADQKYTGCTAGAWSRAWTWMYMIKFGGILSQTIKPKWKRYLKYNLRWQSGFVICYPCMWYFQDYLGWTTAASVIAFQFVGANIFYHVDRWIFKK